MEKKHRHGLWGFIATLLRGINVLRLVILNVVFFGLLALLFFVGGGHAGKVVENNTVLLLHPQGQLVEQYSHSPVSRVLGSLKSSHEREVRVRDLVRAIDQASKDGTIREIVLRPDDLGASGYAALREVRAALERFQASGKRVSVWAHDMDQRQYYLAASADTIVMDPMGSVMVTGLASYRPFYKDLLDKIGAHVHLFRVGKFKSAAEPFVMDHASKEAKEAARYWMGNVWQIWLQDIAKRRHLDVDDFKHAIDHWPQRLQDTGGDMAQLAKAMGMVDKLQTHDQFVASLVADGADKGQHGQGFRHIDLVSYVGNMEAQLVPGTQADVAVIVAEGTIHAGSHASTGVASGRVVRLLQRAKRSEHVKAVVLRVDSPGGEVWASEEIRREIVQLRKAHKPVVVSMGDVAASGGYWISMNADKIYAEPNTVTGSIGIFGMFFTLPETLDKVGIKSDGIGIGPLAGAFDVTRPLDPKLATYMQSSVEKGYRDFVGGVAKARKLDYAKVDSMAQGRVWSGQQAHDHGLVDALGGLKEALDASASLAHLKGDYTVGYVEPQLSGWERMVFMLNENVTAPVLHATGMQMPSWLVAMWRQSASEISVFSDAEAGKANLYSLCFCVAK